MPADDVKMYVINGSKILLDDRLLNSSIQAVTVNNRQLLITAYRPTPDDEVGLCSLPLQSSVGLNVT